MEQQPPEVVKIIAKQALGRALMLLEAERLVLVFPESHLHAPSEGQNQERKESLHALGVAQMGILKMETARFETPEQRFYAPPATVMR